MNKYLDNGFAIFDIDEDVDDEGTVNVMVVLKRVVTEDVRTPFGATSGGNAVAALEFWNNVDPEPQLMAVEHDYEQVQSIVNGEEVHHDFREVQAEIAQQVQANAAAAAEQGGGVDEVVVGPPRLVNPAARGSDEGPVGSL